MVENEIKLNTCKRFTTDITKKILNYFFQQMGKNFQHHQKLTIKNTKAD